MTVFLILSYFYDGVFRRIFKILPHRIQQYQASSCVAEERNRTELEKIRQKQEDARKSILDLDKRHSELDVVVNRAKTMKVPPDYEVRNATFIKFQIKLDSTINTFPNQTLSNYTQS